MIELRSTRAGDMAMTFDVDDLATRLPEMLAEVEAGREVVLARGDRPVARVRRELPPPDPAEVEAVIARIKEIRSRLPPTTIEEILEWRDEGRR